MHVRKTEVAAGVAIGQLGVVDTHQVQDRGVQIANVMAVLHRLVPQIVCRAVRHAAFDPAAG